MQGKHAVFDIYWMSPTSEKLETEIIWAKQQLRTQTGFILLMSGGAKVRSNLAIFLESDLGSKWQD